MVSARVLLDVAVETTMMPTDAVMVTATNGHIVRACLLVVGAGGHEPTPSTHRGRDQESVGVLNDVVVRGGLRMGVRGCRGGGRHRVEGGKAGMVLLNVLVDVVGLVVGREYHRAAAIVPAHLLALVLHHALVVVAG